MVGARERITATQHLNSLRKDASEAEKLIVCELRQFGLQFFLQFTRVEALNNCADHSIIGVHTDVRADGKARVRRSTGGSRLRLCQPHSYGNPRQIRSLVDIQLRLEPVTVGSDRLETNPKFPCDLSAGLARSD